MVRKQEGIRKSSCPQGQENGGSEEPDRERGRPGLDRGGQSRNPGGPPQWAGDKHFPAGEWARIFLGVGNRARQSRAWGGGPLEFERWPAYGKAKGRARTG